MMHESTDSIPCATAATLAALPDGELLETVARQTCRYFFAAAHPLSGLAFDRRHRGERAQDDRVAAGGSGFAFMSLVVAAERGWLPRAVVLERAQQMVDMLARARCYHGAWPHFLDGATGATIPFSRKDDGGDLVETSLLCMGLLCARAYFDRDTPAELRLRNLISMLWEEVEWDWYARDGSVLHWHWSPNNGWAVGHEIRGWNECLITYVLAAASPRYAAEPAAYHRGFAAGRHFLSQRHYYGIELPLGPPFGGPLFFAHYSFCGLDPRGLRDRYADYWEQNVRHVRIHRAHCRANPGGFRGYGENCWGLTASDDPHGYAAHAPDHDNGTIAPTAALASLPYAPTEVTAMIRHLLRAHGERIWTELGFVDAFCEQQDWYADTCLAIDQGPIIIMIENHRSALLWRLFMGTQEVQRGLQALGFTSPWLTSGAPR